MSRSPTSCPNKRDHLSAYRGMLELGHESIKHSVGEYGS